MLPYIQTVGHSHMMGVLLALMIAMLIKSAWQVIILGIRLADVVPFHLCFNPPSLFSGNYLTPVTFCVGLPQLMASLCSSQSLLFWNERRAAMCLYTTLLLPGIKCCLLIKMSPWQRICRKGFFLSSALSVKQDGCLVSQRDIWSSCWCVLSGVSGLWEGDSDTAVAAEWNQWWMTCQNGPRCLPRRLCWQAQLSRLTFSISRANRGSCWPQMWHVNIAPVIAHLSTSHSQRAGFRSLIIEWNLLW